MVASSQLQQDPQYSETDPVTQQHLRLSFLWQWLKTLTFATDSSVLDETEVLTMPLNDEGCQKDSSSSSLHGLQLKKNYSNSVSPTLFNFVTNWRNIVSETLKHKVLQITHRSSLSSSYMSSLKRHIPVSTFFFIFFRSSSFFNLVDFTPIWLFIFQIGDTFSRCYLPPNFLEALVRYNHLSLALSDFKVTLLMVHVPRLQFCLIN